VQFPPLHKFPKFHLSKNLIKMQYIFFKFYYLKYEWMKNSRKMRKLN
jgi:hypothetical protein